MFEADDIRDWRGKNVVDIDGDKIGSLEGIYVDTATDLPYFATVQVGIVGRHKLVFVPLVDATVAPDHVRVRYDKQLVKEAPSIATDGAGLEAADEPLVFDHYGMPYSTGASGERRLARR